MSNPSSQLFRCLRMFLLKSSLLLVVLLVSVDARAQASVHSSWGEGTGMGWSITYSIGQVFTFQSNLMVNNLRFSEGVQQPYEISRLGINILNNVRVYPNPTEGDVVIQISGNFDQLIHYRLSDYRGRTILSGAINGEFTPLSLTQFSSSMYLLEVKSQGEETQTFRIIKK